MRNHVWDKMQELSERAIQIYETAMNKRRIIQLFFYKMFYYRLLVEILLRFFSNCHLIKLMLGFIALFIVLDIQKGAIKHSIN